LQSLVAATDENVFFRENRAGKHGSVLDDLIDFQDISIKNFKSR